MPKLKFETLNTVNGAKLKISSFQPIKEPIVNFVLQIRYKDVLIYKEITLLLDPIEKYNATNLNQNKLKLEQTVANDPLMITPTTKRQQVNVSPLNTQQPNSFRVKRGQNLWSIAKNWPIKNANLNQKMRAIFLSNQQAFINGDINKLKQGAIINLSQDSLSLESLSPASSNTNSSNTNSSKIVQIKNKALTHMTDTPEQVSTNNNQKIEKEIASLNSTIEQQELLNITLKAELEQLEKQILFQTDYNNSLQKITQTKSPTIIKSQNELPLSTTAIDLINKPPKLIENLENGPSSSQTNLWLTSIWFGLALILAYLGTILSSKRNAKKFAQNLDSKLQDLAYNKQKQLSETPSIKELSIPANLSTSVQIKYLNSAADFYIRCHRHDLAKELVNEGLVQFKGNTQIIETLNQIRKRIFNDLDNDIQAHIVEKLDHRKTIEETQNDETNDIDDFNTQWLKEWDKKVS